MKCVNCKREVPYRRRDFICNECRELMWEYADDCREDFKAGRKDK